MRYFYLCFIVMNCLLLMSCEKGDRESEIQYIHAFPREDSPALTGFMDYFLFHDSGIFLFKEDKTTIYAVRSLSSDKKEINYYAYEDMQIKEYYKPILRTDNARETFYELIIEENGMNELKRNVNKYRQYDLPFIELLENNQLKVETNKGKKLIDLPHLMKEYGVTGSDRLIINLKAVDKQTIVLAIQDTSIKLENGASLHLGLFVKQDLSDLAVMTLYDLKFRKILETGRMNDYLDVFPKLDEKGKYFYLFEHTIFDIKTNKIIEISNDDLISSDGKYVYINGKDLSGGNQKIQTIENYAKKNNVYEMRFSLDLSEIAKKLDLSTNGNASIDINYFNKNYAVLRLDYTGKFVGTAGGTNVIVDLQKDENNPIFYLVDLDILGGSRTIR
ncbi:hypothetical protein [Metabacillus fastidiosus]|uniref:hypothetical protein n=1 Tax=Metabacillus fastidiosus TaxID=1458 RepID=UPI003D271D2D